MFLCYEFHGQVGRSPASFSIGPQVRSPQDSSCLDWGIMFYYSQSNTMLVDVFNRTLRTLVPSCYIFGQLILFVTKVFIKFENVRPLVIS